MGTPAEQGTYVGEGLALGVLRAGFSAVALDREAVESAFGEAWDAWPWRRSFPRVQADLDRERIWAIMHRSEGRLRSCFAYWVQAGPYFHARSRVGRTPAEHLGLLAGRSGVPVDAWDGLSRDVLRVLGEERLVRASSTSPSPWGAVLDL
ncbi:hypothetical protein [Actinomycetospora sp. TBRC 11914]|uniref:hypothetical protein n=1 Tax=Actinomycetospora sp. TBRC 11914 TaxID=2729387 RepID=UPI00145CA63D|nr:hypothetical protein [Actinomycetospora sp. TBRC 11914]NMO91641.1 hypothetical protein [Actinomycetospora sp. TBRC 11914]